MSSTTRTTFYHPLVFSSLLAIGGSATLDKFRKQKRSQITLDKTGLAIEQEHEPQEGIMTSDDDDDDDDDDLDDFYSVCSEEDYNDEYSTIPRTGRSIFGDSVSQKYFQNKNDLKSLEHTPSQVDDSTAETMPMDDVLSLTLRLASLTI